MWGGMLAFAASRGTSERKRGANRVSSFARSARYAGEVYGGWPSCRSIINIIRASRGWVGVVWDLKRKASRASIESDSLPTRPSGTC